MILDEIKKANVQAMKEHDSVARAIYGVVMNKAMLASIELKKDGKVFLDQDMIKILQKTIKELDEERENYIKVGNQTEADNIRHQSELISIYLPQMMNEDEIRREIEKLSDRSIPSVMRHFKENFAGKVHMSIVSKIARG